MDLPRRVRIAGRTFVPALVRIESFREHDGKPDTLTFLDEEDMIELSTDPSKNQFATVLVDPKVFSSNPDRK